MKCDRCRRAKRIVGIQVGGFTWTLGRWSLTVERARERFCAACLTESGAPVTPQMLQDIQDRLEEGER